MDNLHKFNVTFEEFIEDLVKVIPGDPELRVYEMLLRGAVSNDPRYVSDVFHEYVVIPYESAILSKNEDFFIDHSFDNIASSSKALDIITRIKSYWKELTPENKEVVWRYFRVLVLLDKRLQD